MQAHPHCKKSQSGLGHQLREGNAETDADVVDFSVLRYLSFSVGIWESITSVLYV